MPGLTIRPYRESDWDGVRQIVVPAFRAGEALYPACELTGLVCRMGPVLRGPYI